MHSLEIENSYAHKKAFFEFNPGLTTITGLNGTGKSEILEIIQWLLFGTKALRGESIAKATLHFEVKGKTYSVFRHKSKATLSDEEGYPIATGTKPVNARILELLGYTYEVFTVANCVNQGKIDELGEMLPSQRKRMVDATIGLDKLDDITKWISAELSAVNGELKGHEKYLVEPTPIGEDPAPHWTLEEIRERWGQLLVSNTERNGLLNTANRTLVEVELNPQTAELPSMRQAQEQRQQGLGAIDALRRVADTLPRREGLAVPQAHPLAGELEKLEAETKEALRLQEKVDALALERRALLLPDLTEEQIVEMENAWVMYDQIQERDRIRLTQVEITCPKCQFVFSKDDDRLKIYEGLPETMEKPKHSLQFLLRERKHLPNKERYEKISLDMSFIFDQMKEVENHTQLIAVIKAKQILIDRFAVTMASVVQREQLEGQIEELQKMLPPDNKNRIDELEWNIRTYKDYQDLKAQKEAALEKLQDYPENLPALVQEMANLYQFKGTYVAEKIAYDAALEVYRTHRGEFDRLSAEKTDWENAKKGITLMRERVKTYLIPSLNKVTSMLLNQFSSGWLKQVHVDEEFNITVDAKDISTLSGAGKAFANLALRVGLGLVLTNGVFSVLMLDEIDAGVDREKAPALADALRSLTHQIKQVIYVSHKSNLESDYAISL